jgi:hypothetical protein
MPVFLSITAEKHIIKKIKALLCKHIMVMGGEPTWANPNQFFWS